MSNTIVKIYHNNSNKYALSQILSLGESDKIKLVSHNISNEPMTPTQLLQLKDRLKMNMSELLSKDFPHSNSSDPEDLEIERIADLLSKDPSYMLSPIADDGKSAIVLKQPTDILKFKNIDHCIDGHDHLKSNQ